VQHRIDALGGEDVFHRGAVAHVGVVERQARIGRELAQAREHRGFRIAEVVDHYGPVARPGEHDAGVRTDVAEAAGDQDIAGFPCCGLHFPTDSN